MSSVKSATFNQTPEKGISLSDLAESVGAVEHTKCFSEEGVRHPKSCPGYDTKQSDGEVPVMLEVRGMRSTSSLPSLPGPLCPGVVAPDKGPIYGLNRTKLCYSFLFYIYIYI